MFSVYRAYLHSGDVECDTYDHTERGVELYDDEEGFLAFVPYENLLALVDEETAEEVDRSIV